MALVMVSMALALALLWGFAREQDKAFEDTSTRLVESAWASRENASARVALDYAVWNDAYLSTTVRWNAEWVDNNYYSSIADAVFVVRADGVVRHAWLADALQPQAHAIQAGVVEAVEHDFNLLALLSAPRKEDMTATTLFVSNGEPVLVSIAPISPEEQTVRQERDPDLPVDYLVAVDLVTAVELAEIGASLQTSGLRFASSQPAGGDPVHIQRPMAAATGVIVGALSWDRQRPGSDAFLGNVGLIVAVLSLVGAMAILLARRLVSDQLRAAAEVSVAVEASRVKSDFISTMSHELRTPLNAIMGYTELIKESLEDGASPEALNAEADRVLGAAKHLSRLINDVLDQSRIDAGKLQVSLENVEIAGVLSELEELVAPLAQANGNRLSVSADEGVRFVTADPMRLQQCLINLTGNALKFTHAGEVKVHARLLLDHAHAYVSFDVSDTGIGMDKNELERLFKPFAQANKKIGAKYGGTGLGLSITKNLARAMGGDVTAESALGKGSTFRLRLRAGEAVARTGPRLVHAA
jgi:signal transduction histidine kinase